MGWTIGGFINTVANTASNVVQGKTSLPAAVNTVTTAAATIATNTAAAIGNNLPSGQQYNQTAQAGQGVLDALGGGLASLPIPGAQLFAAAPAASKLLNGYVAGALDVGRNVLGADPNSRNPFTDMLNAFVSPPASSQRAPDTHATLPRPTLAPLRTGILLQANPEPATSTSSSRAVPLLIGAGVLAVGVFLLTR